MISGDPCIVWLAAGPAVGQFIAPGTCEGEPCVFVRFYGHVESIACVPQIVTPIGGVLDARSRGSMFINQLGHA